ncbi:MAG TPA: MMPL family transporter [Gaiellaceae bacterium]|nr:MMPL family transporter [Gaiellaceae bacterium]
MVASASHPWRTIAVWTSAAVLGIVAVGSLLGGSLSSDNHPTDTRESKRAENLIERSFPAGSGAAATDVIVLRSDRHTVASPRFRSVVSRLAADVRAESGVAAKTYLDTRNAPLVSQDRHATIIPVDIADSDATDGVIAAVGRADASAGFSAAITGDETRQHDFDQLSQDDLKSGELQFGLPAALIVLMLVFGAVVAGLIPLLLAMVSIVIGLGIVAALAQVMDLSVFVVNMLTGMGLALGIDYALFVVSRYREERGQGREKLGAIEASSRTANRAVVFSGTAFVIAMFGMLIVPNNIMRSLAIGAIVVGIVSVIGATTLLPALLGLLGDGVDRLRIPFVGRRAVERSNPEGRFWGAIIRSVLRRPALSLALSTAVLLLAAMPIFSMSIGTSGVSALPKRFESRQGYVALQQSFPGATASPVEIVVPNGSSDPAARKALLQLRSRLASDPRFGPGRIDDAADGDALLTVPVQGDASSEGAVAAVRNLRSTIVPAAFAGTNARPQVGGRTSEDIDYIDSATDPTPIVIALVLGLTLVLLTAVFRSLVIAALTVVLNLLSVGAAYGLIVLVFQHGVGAGLFGFERSDTIEAWVPLFLFSVLFGLSMDYQVFLLSRIKERYDQVGNTTEAVTFGVASTARIITGAALIIIAVFTGFARGELIMFQQMGFGVAVALLIDATIVRSILLPSAMSLLGRWNWYLPSWLRWLPRIQIEGARASASPS